MDATQAGTALELLPRDIRHWRAGNTGVDYVHRIESGRPGPHVMINALTHGNEFCGMVAVEQMLAQGLRPLRGTLTLSFANVAAYESFDPARPYDSRQLVHNLNRVWSAEWLDGPHDSPELSRARQMRDTVAQADHLLDIHSTSQEVEPFWVYPALGPNAQVAQAIGLPAIHLVMPKGLGSGVPVIQYGRFGEPGERGAALVVECGQHFRLSSADVAVEVARRFLVHFGLIEGSIPAPAQPARRFELLSVHVVRTESFVFARPCVGLERFARGELIATDGDQRIEAPCDDCTVFMPTRMPIVGREGVYLTRPLD